MMLIVLGLNDCPIGVYDSEQAAEAARDEHKKENPYREGQMMRYYWTRPFQLNTKARF